jgi:hypothetical protein
MELKENKTFRGIEIDTQKGLLSSCNYLCIYSGDSDVTHTNERRHFHIKPEKVSVDSQY